jgi:hypothetical protein
MATRARRDRLEVHRDPPPRVVPRPPSAGDAAEPPSPVEPAPVPEATSEAPSADTGDRGPEPLDDPRDDPLDDVAGHLAGAASADPEQWVEPELYGVRTSWQSEAVRIEAAEFLVATRVQESSRRRLARLTQRLRDQAAAEGRGA